MTLSFGISALRTFPRLLGGPARSRRLQRNARPARLVQADSNGLFRIPDPMLSLPDLFHFRPYKFAGLRAGRFSLPPVLFRFLYRFLVWHARWFFVAPAIDMPTEKLTYFFALAFGLFRPITNPKKGGNYGKHHQERKCPPGNFWKCC
jgi:hypothetical protein